MLDGLSAIASVITIVEAVSQAVKYVRAFYRASKEFEALQNQIDQFERILQEVDNQQWLSSPTVTAALSSARAIIEQLNKLLKDKILTEVNGSSGVRRRAWAKYRTKIYGIQHSLADYKANLMIAILSNSSPSAISSEALLISISREVGVLGSNLHSISGFPESSTYTTPSTALEHSSHFFPERYTAESQIPRSCLIVTAAYKQFTRPDTLRNVYKVFYMKSPRQWSWLDLSIEIASSSKYWETTQLAQGAGWI